MEAEDLIALIAPLGLTLVAGQFFAPDFSAKVLLGAMGASIGFCMILFNRLYDEAALHKVG